MKLNLIFRRFLCHFEYLLKSKPNQSTQEEKPFFSSMAFIQCICTVTEQLLQCMETTSSNYGAHSTFWFYSITFSNCFYGAAIFCWSKRHYDALYSTIQYESVLACHIRRRSNSDRVMVMKRKTRKKWKS